MNSYDAMNAMVLFMQGDHLCVSESLFKNNNFHNIHT